MRLDPITDFFNFFLFLDVDVFGVTIFEVDGVLDEVFEVSVGLINHNPGTITIKNFLPKRPLQIFQIILIPDHHVPVELLNVLLSFVQVILELLCDGPRELAEAIDHVVGLDMIWNIEFVILSRRNHYIF